MARQDGLHDAKASSMNNPHRPDDRDEVEPETANAGQAFLQRDNKSPLPDQRP
jgi:hypothetical protein